MRAYLVDPYTETVVEITYNGDYKTIYDHIDCDCFCVAGLNKEGDGVYVDDEGLLTMSERTKFFVTTLYPQALAGKGLVLGVDEEGNSTSPVISLEDFKKTVRFMTYAKLRLMFEESL